MIFAILSDVHANEIALSAVLADARRFGATKIICLGDVVGYGPEPAKTVALIRQNAAVTLAGNHDDAVSGRISASDFIDLAADAVARHQEALSQESIAWLKNLPYTCSCKSFICSHGDFTSPKTFEYISDESDAAANFAIRSEQLMFVGHSHVPGIFLTGASGKVYALAPTDFTLEDGKRYIVNPGSVGYPRTNGSTCESTYVLYDDKERTVTFRRIPFTVRSVMQTGRNPKRMKKSIIAAMVAAAAIAAAAISWLAMPRKRIETVTEVVTNNITQVIEKKATDASAIRHIDRTTERTINQGVKKVQLHVKLAKSSPPAQLQLIFLNADGKTIADERWTVKKSKTAKIKVPSGAVKAILSARRAIGDVPATFTEFAIDSL